MSGKQYYRVPVTMEEIHRLQFTDSSNVVKYFKTLFDSPRPTNVPPLLLFEQDDSYPDELFGIVYDETGTVLHFLYVSSKTMIYPSLKKFKLTQKFHLHLTEFEKFKKENSHFRHLFKDSQSNGLPLLLDRSLLSTGQQQLAKSSMISSSLLSNRNVVIKSVLVLFFLISLFFLRYNKQPPVSTEVSDYLEKVQNPQKRKKLLHLLRSIQDPANKNLLVGYLQDPRVLAFLNENLRDEQVITELKTFFHSLSDKKTRRLMQQLLPTTKKQKTIQRPSSTIPTTVVPKEKVSIVLPLPKQEKEFTVGKLAQFLRKNKQTIVSTHGAVSPHFQEKLLGFLQQQNAPHPDDILTFLTSHAIPLAKSHKTHREITDQLLHLLTEQRPFQKRSVLPPPSISPVRKSLSRRKVVTPKQEQSKQQQQSKQQTTPTIIPSEWIELVERIAKPQQTPLGVAVLDANIQQISHTSKTFREIVPTLCQVIQSRQISTVYVVDAPNLLTPISTSYGERQKDSNSLSFVSMLKRHIVGMEDEKALVLIVAQMNKKEWKNNDPVYFGRIGRDQENIFLVRVGCFDDSLSIDCYKSKNTGFHNECDDFVRLDVMARILHTFQQEGIQPPTIIHITNDKNRNWRFHFSEAILPFPLSFQTDLKTWLKEKKRKIWKKKS